MVSGKIVSGEMVSRRCDVRRRECEEASGERISSSGECEEASVKWYQVSVKPALSQATGGVKCEV